MPSETAIVTNSKGTPPASRTATFARLASRSSGRLHGVTSFQLDATPIWGLAMSSSVRPMARNIARAGARLVSQGDFSTSGSGVDRHGESLRNEPTTARPSGLRLRVDADRLAGRE